VVGYLPNNIPRILINRTIVHPKHSYDDENVGNTHEADFRDGYVFDAYLLGYCDDINRVLATLLFDTTQRSKSSRGHATSKIDKLNCKLLATLQGDDEEFNANDWMAATKVPYERVFLFPGAQTPVVDYVNNRKDFNEPLCREVVFCDGCAKKVVGKVQKCVLCFDYDLCLVCYPSHSKTHYEGKHRFVTELTALENNPSKN
jgi:Zinc finger, ZZ type